MPYSVTKSDGVSTITVADSTVNTTLTNIPLVGINTPNYPAPIAQAMVRMLENFASDTAPGGANINVTGQPLTGQLWYNTTTGMLNVYDGTQFNSIFGGSGAGLDLVAASITADGTCSLTGNFVLTAGSTFEATYADLAERFHSDKEYDMGTLLELGGVNEVTSTKQAGSSQVFGVVAQNPAYIMNATAGDNSSHPAVALAGRVQVKTVGVVKKGDRLISSNIEGVAKAADGILDWTQCFGRALEDKSSDEVGLVWVAVGAK